MIPSRNDPRDEIRVKSQFQEIDSRVSTPLNRPKEILTGLPENLERKKDPNDSMEP